MFWSEQQIKDNATYKHLQFKQDTESLSPEEEAQLEDIKPKVEEYRDKIKKELDFLFP